MQIFIEDLMFFVSQFLEAHKCVIQHLFAVDLDAELFQARLEGRPSGMLA
jgi:hypothetical protein